MTSSVIFIDWRVEDPQSIIAGLPAGSVWYILTSGEDGIEQIRRIAAEHSNLDSIQIVSHGSAGALLLGSAAVDARSLATRASALADIGRALSPSGDLLLYGCDVAQGDEGQAFVDALARLTGADVAASTDATGAASNGGNWILEASSGTIEAAPLGPVGYGQLLGPATARIAPTVAFKAEGLSGLSAFTFTVTRTGDLSAAQSVFWSVDGAGPNGAVATDFEGNVLPSGSLDFEADQAFATITVNVQGGFGAEPSEGFTVTLSNPTNGLSIDVNATSAGATIIDGLGSVYRASIDPIATEANDLSEDSALSPDGGMVAFVSRATNLVDDDFLGFDDIFVKDLTTGIVTRVSTDEFGGEANGESARPVFSPTGGQIAFSSWASNLVASDTNFQSDIFIKNLSTGIVTRVSTDAFGAEANGSSYWAVFSPDGTRVAFVSHADNLVDDDENGASDIFVKTLIGGEIQRVSTTSSGLESAGGSEGGPASYDPAFAPDGTRVAFVSEAENLVAGDTNDAADIFIKNLTDGAVTRVTVNAGGVQADGHSYEPAFSPDGARVVFTSYASNLVSDDFNEVSDVFVKNLSTGAVTRVSTNAAGEEANGSSSGAVFSPDGARVFFVSTATNLVAGDTNSAADIFVKDLFSGAIARVSTTAFGSQTSLSGDSYQLAISSDGNHLSFTSLATNLVTGDTNLQQDIFIRSFSSVVISALDAVKAEGDAGTSFFTFTVTRSGDTTQAQSLVWSVAGSGADGADFGGSTPSGVVAFAAAETSKTISIAVSGDTDIEGDEGFTVNLSAPSVGLFIMGGSASGTIENDDASIVSIAAHSAVHPEGNGGTTEFIFTISLDQPIPNFETVKWAVTGSGDHPANAADFGGTMPSGLVSFSYYDTTVTITVGVTGDSSGEFDEGFAVTLSDPTSGLEIGTASATGTIQNDDAATVSIAPLSATKPEGNGGTSSFTFTVSLNQAAVTSQTIQWSVAGSGGHAASGADFGGSSTSGTTTFIAGDTMETVTIAVTGDGTVEFDEEFTITLSNASSGLVIGDATASGTIQNDDFSTVSITAESAVKAEGDSGTTSFTFTVSLDKAGVVSQTVDWAVAGSGLHAANADDFGGSFPADSLTFAAGETSKTVTVLVSGDATIEFDEEFTVALSGASPGLALGTATASGTIQTDDRAVASIAAQSAAKAEGNAGTTAFTFTVSLDRAMPVGQSVDWAVAGAGAHPANAADFGGILHSGNISFAAGETSATINVFVAGDAEVEHDEELVVTLSNASSGLVLGNSSAAGTIQNDDVSTVSIAPLSASKAEGDGGSTSFTFTVSLDKAGVVSQTVNWAVTGTGVHAANAVDFAGAFPSGSATFAAGETSQTVTVSVSTDTTVEPDEGFSVGLSGASTGLALGTATANGTIQNDDRSVVSIAALSAIKPEGNSGSTSFTFTVSLDQVAVVGQTVDWSVTGAGTHAANAADFGASSGSLTFAAGEITKTVTVSVSADTTVEQDEGFTVALSNVSAGLTLGTSSASGTIQNDDRSTVSIAAAVQGVAEGDSGPTPFTFTITLDQAGVISQSIEWALVGSGAHPAEAGDFGGAFPTGAVSFAPGETTKTASIDVSGDTALEATEGFTIALAHPSAGLTLGAASSITGAIINDDGLIVSIADLSAIKVEGNGGQAFFTFTVRLNHLIEIEGPTVDWSVTGSGDHPADGADFGGPFPSGTVTFGPHQQVAVVTVLVSGDGLVELDETFAVTLSNPAEGLSIGVGTANGIIENDDLAVVSIAATSAIVAEGNGGGTTAFIFEVSLDQASVMAQSVGWSFAGIGAHAASAADLTGGLSSGSVTFAAGETSKIVTVQVAADGVVEHDEGFAVTLANASAGLALGTISATGTILNDDRPAASIDAVSANLTEGDSGTKSFTFTVSLDQAGLTSETIDWAVAGVGLHDADANDFGGGQTSGSLTFAVGETSKVVIVTVSGDSQVEPDEAFTVVLSNASPGLALGAASAGGTIVNDDRSIVSIAPLSAIGAEGDNGPTSFTFALSLDQAGVTEQSIALSVTGSGPHAADAADFGGTLPSWIITFGAGETSRIVTIDITGDVDVELDEGFDVTLSNASAGLVIGVPTASGTIQNDDKPEVSIAAVSADKVEGNSGSTAFTFVVSLDQPAVADQTVDWNVSGAGAHPASVADFGGAFPSGTLTFALAETSMLVTVLVSGDTVVELDEQFAVNLSNASAGLVLGTATAAATIRNDDRSVASISALSATKPEGDSGVTLFTFAVTLDQVAFTDQIIGWSVTGSGTHPADAADFDGTLLSGTTTLASGEATTTVTVAVASDAIVEFDEEFTVTLSAPSAGVELGIASAQGLIQDDDKPTVSIAALTATQAEGSAGTTAFTFTLTLSQAAVVSQTVAWAVTGTGSHPADAADFGGSLSTGIATFAPGETIVNLTVAVSGDLAPEFDEGFSVGLSSPSPGLALGVSVASGTIVNDDGSALTIAPLAAASAEGDAEWTSFTFVLNLSKAGVLPSTVGWAVSGIGASAADASDFGGAFPTGTISFAPGETSAVLTVLVSGDLAVEQDESFQVTLSNPSADLDLVIATATGTILNDDQPKVSIAAQSAAKPEGTGGMTAFTFVVSLDQAGKTSQTVGWSVAGSGAHAADAADFAGASSFGTVTFAAGETASTVTVLVAADAVPELDETFDVTLANVSAGLAPGTMSASGIIRNDDLSVSIAALSAVKAEGNAGMTPFTFLVTLTGETTLARSVDFVVSFSGGDPAVSSDFAGNAFTAGTVAFAPGEIARTVVVNVAGDVVKEANETFAVTLANPSAGVAIGTASATGTILNDDVLPSLPPVAHHDAYVVFPGQTLQVDAASGVLFNDGSTVPLTASLLSGPDHGVLALVPDGSFDYMPDPGFFGIDIFSYRAAGIGSTSDEHAFIYVTPLTGAVTVSGPVLLAAVEPVTATATLDLTRLTAEEQVAATYVAFFGRGPDSQGFKFWVHEFTVGSAGQGAATLLADIASSFAISDEAKSLYPFLADPFDASDDEIGSFLDTVYNNLFNRSADVDGLAYWTDQIQETLAAGGFVGSVLTNIMSGAQNTEETQDITTLMGKVAVGLSYVHDQERFHVPWTATDDLVDATALLDAVTADPQAVLIGIVQAYNLAFASLARTDGYGETPGGMN